MLAGSWLSSASIPSKKNKSLSNQRAATVSETSRSNFGLPRIHDTSAMTALQDNIITPDEPILITGANGFIGPRVVEGLLNHGFRNLRCLMRAGGDSSKLAKYADQIGGNARVEIVRGNL